VRWNFFFVAMQGVSGIAADAERVCNTPILGVCAHSHTNTTQHTHAHTNTTQHLLNTTHSHTNTTQHYYHTTRCVVLV